MERLPPLDDGAADPAAPRRESKLAAIGLDRTSLLIYVLMLLTIATVAKLKLPRPGKYIQPWPTDWVNDIDYLWYDGYEIRQGHDPYARIVGHDLSTNWKYSTYFPAFYLLSAGTQWIWPDFGPWLAFWKSVFVVFHAATGVLIFAALRQRGWVLLALFAFMFWMLNRWTLHVLDIAQIDLMGVFFLVLSMVLFRRHRLASLLCLGASLSIKQLAVVLVPLYLIWIWHDAAGMPPGRRVRRVVLSAAAIASIPLLLSIPFLIWNTQGFVYSILFTLTRAADNHFGVDSIDVMLGLSGAAGRMIELYLVLLVYAAAAQRQIGRFTAVLLTIALFLDFNPVLFRQYPCWLVPFIPLSLCDAAGAPEPARSLCDLP